MFDRAARLFYIFFFSFITPAALGQSVKYTVKLSHLNATNEGKRRVINSVYTNVVPPQISYSGPQTYPVNQPIVPLAPTNTGGQVPQATYGQVSTLRNFPLSTATGIAVDAAGNVYVADWGTNQIKKLTPTGVVSIFAGSAGGGSGASDGQGTAARFNTPDALVTDRAGNMYVADQANDLIRKITPDGFVSTIAGSGTPGSNNGTGRNASFDNPRGLTIDDSGNLYVADQANNLIRKITPAGVVSTFAGVIQGGSQNGPRLGAGFNSPTAVEVDAAGNLYVSDAANNVIRKISAAGDVTNFATGMYFPRELRIDGTGNLYVADASSNTVKRISPAGVVTVIAGNGNSGHTDGPGRSATFTALIGLVLDGKGNLFVADREVARKICISGYTIDQTLPAGLVFDKKTGIISGTPSVLWPATTYTITGYNGGGSSTTTVTLQVLGSVSQMPSIITLPAQNPNLDANNNYDPGATSTNHETPITYTSSNEAVAVITANGLIHVLGPGVTTITAFQAGNANYLPATPVSQTLTVVEHLVVSLPAIATKTTCDADFNANASTSNASVPLTYSSSDLAVAEIAANGQIHINGAGTTNITVYQNGNPPLYVSALPQTRTLTVTLPVLPTVQISASYESPCAGAAVTFTATAQNSGNNGTYQWMVNGVAAGTNTFTLAGYPVKNGDVVSCSITNNDNACIAAYPAQSNIVSVNLTAPSTPTISISASANAVFPGTAVTFNANTQQTVGNVTYQWYVNGLEAGINSPAFTSSSLTDGDVVTCTISTDAACSAPAVSNELTVSIVERVEIPNTFTPNGDGTNDMWNIKGIASYPDCVVNIYSRNGALLYQSKGYGKPWDGTSNGSALPTANYYYVIDLGLQAQKLSGSVTIIR